MADEDCSVDWLTLTSLCNLIVAQGRIPDDWTSTVVFCYRFSKGKEIQWIVALTER